MSELARGGPAIVVISGGTAAEAFVDLGVTVGPTGQPLGTTGPGLGLGMTQGIAASFVGAAPMALLWRGRCVCDRRWSALTVRDRGGDPPTVHGGDSDDRPEPYIIEVEHPDDLPTEVLG